MKQEWDWPPERLPPIPQGTGWASTAAKKYTSWYLRFIITVLKVIVGAACGLGIVLVIMAMQGLIKAI